MNFLKKPKTVCVMITCLKRNRVRSLTDYKSIVIKKAYFDYIKEAEMQLWDITAFEKIYYDEEDTFLVILHQK